MDYYKDKAEVTLICICTRIMGHSILYPHPPKEEVNQNLPPQKILNSLFPSEKSQFFPNPLGNIQKIKGADATTPSEMTIKGPSENLFHWGGVDIKWNGAIQCPPLFITVIILIAPPGGVKCHK